MNWKTWVPLALAIVLGVVAMKIAKDMMANRSGGGEGQQRFVEAVVAKEAVNPGTALTPNELMIGKLPPDVAPDSIFRSIDELSGRVVTAPLVKGQPVLSSLLAPQGTGAGLQALVPKGMRAITLEINEFSGLAGYLVAGCHVDVVSTISGDDGEVVSRTVVQNVKVTALGQRRQNEAGPENAEPTRSVTLLVSPKEAEAIELAASTGRPRLVLRAAGDDIKNASTGITVAQLRGDAHKKRDPFSLPVELFMPRPSTQPANDTTPVAVAPQQPVVREHTVRVIRGGVESHVTMVLPPEKGRRFMTDAKN